MPRPGTKQSLLISLLSRDGGANIRELVEVTGWKANTVHSALATLRTSGWQIVVEQKETERRYIIMPDSAAIDELG